MENMSKKISVLFTITTIFILCICYIPFSVRAISKNDNDVYEIATPQDLVDFSVMVNSGNTNEKIETGLFGRASKATIRNVGIKNANISNSAGVRSGILAGELLWSNVSNIMTTGTVSTTNEQKGGISGEAYESTLSNCFSSFSPCTNNLRSTITSCGVCTELFAFNGFGIEQRPYIINRAEDLIKLSRLSNDEKTAYAYSSSYYLQKSDIDLNNIQFTPICKTSKYGKDGYLPHFSGHYNGNYHKIKNIYVSESSKFAGLFGTIYGNGVLENLSVTGQVNNTDKYSTGGIVGEIGEDAIVRNCDFTGTVSSSKSAVGGIAGYIWQKGTIENCYHNGEVSAEGSAGGIVGQIVITSGDYSAVVRNCYSIGEISGTYAGSIVRYTELSDPYSSANITIENCYSLEKYKDDTVSGSYSKYDVASLTRSELKKAAEKLGNPFATNLVSSYNNGYPIFKWQLEDAENSRPITIPFAGDGTEYSPYQIETADDVFMLSEVVNDKETGDYFRDCYYIQTADIDLNGKFLTPIGLNGGFTGFYNGNYHSIINLKISTSKKYTGLFSSLKDGGKIEKLSIEGTVSASNDNVGGIVGTLGNDTEILDCDFHGSVLGNNNIGALVGSAEDKVIMKSCYSDAKVTGKSTVGGLIGNAQAVSAGSEMNGMYFSGTITSENEICGAICGISNNQEFKINNIYFLASICNGNAINGKSAAGCTKLGEAALKACADMLGTPFTENESIQYGGYPIFEWQSVPYQLKGAGTAENPYKTSTKEDLEHLRDFINSSYYNQVYSGAYFVQTADIDLKDELWIPIGSAESKQVFHGSYDGACHYIKGLNINTDTEYAGLFGVATDASLSDIVVTGSITGFGTYSGGIAGQADNTKLERCAFVGDVSAETASGGLVGTMINGGIISDCYHNGIIYSNKYAAGIIGSIFFEEDVKEHNIVIQNCYQANGTVSGKKYSGCIAGDCTIKKETGNMVSILNCFATTDADAEVNLENVAKNNTLLVTKSMLKNSSEDLGEQFINHTDATLNNGYPVFKWQVLSTVLGDVNNDGRFDVSDVVMMQKWILGFDQITNWANGDWNEDHQINVIDLCLMKQKIKI